MCKSRLFLCCLMALFLFGLPAFAQTPDGQTPAKEDVCDTVKGYQGLYGLCVAFCEAQDLDAPTTKKNRQKILDNYKNLQLASGGPDMPCPSAATEPDTQPSSSTQLSCPCWSAAEADAIDGVLSDGSTARGWPAPSSDSSACSIDPLAYIQETTDNQSEFTLIEAIDSPQYPQHSCLYAKRLNGTLFMFSLSVEAGTLTAEQLADCKSDILARQAALKLCQ